MECFRGTLDSIQILYIPLLQIHPCPTQPRRTFEPEALRELSVSIAQYGILQPLTVRQAPHGYELIAGERRLRAARIAGLREVPCILLQANEEQASMLTMIENLQRQDLDYLEEARGLALLMSRFHLSQEQLACKIGKSQSAVANKVRLLRHSPTVLRELQRNGLSERHARALLRLPEEAARLQAIGVIVEKQLSAAKTEEYITSCLEKQPLRKVKKGRFMLRDLRLFLNTVEHSLELIRDAGFQAQTHRQETEEEIILTIHLPKQKTT